MSRKYYVNGSFASFNNLHSVDMDGSNEYAQAADNAAFSFTGGAPDLPFSLVTCFKRDGAVTNNALFGKVTAGTNNSEWYAQLISGTLQFLTTNVTSAIFRGRTAPMATTGSWVIIAMVYTGGGTVGSFEIYNLTTGTAVRIDNANLTAGVYAGMSNGTSPLYIGAINSGGVIRTFNGLRFHPQVWNIALSTAQLNEIAATPEKDVRLYSFGANCVSAWHFNNGTSDYPNWTDYVNGRTATMQNAEASDIILDAP